MTQQNEFQKEQIHSTSLLKRMAVGAGIGLFLISIFLMGTGESDPDWGRTWMIRPLVIVPLAGAMGGLCNYLLVQYHNDLKLNKTIAIILSGIIFLIGLWLGFVLGLDGTMWD